MPEYPAGGAGAVAVTYPVTAAGDMTWQPGGVANNALSLQNPASAVNGVRLTGAATGSTPTIAATGSDANVGLNLASKGAGRINFVGSGGAAYVDSGGGLVTSGQLYATGNAAVQMLTGAALVSAANAHTLMVDGSTSTQFGDYVRISSDRGGNGNVLRVTPMNNVANGFTLTPALAGSPPILAAVGSDTNVALQLRGQGTQGVQFGSGGSAILSGTGVPNNANGNNGDLYIRVDGAALTTIYQRRAGAWVATAA